MSVQNGNIKFMKRITTSFVILLVSIQLFSQDIQSSFIYKLNQDITEYDENKYLEVRNYLERDSLFLDKSIYFSPYLADLDFFYFKNEVSKDSILSKKLYYKSRWFEDFYSLRLDNIMGKQIKDTYYIAFFSLVENEMLRVDIFQNRRKTFFCRFEDISLFPGNKTYSYLFYFEKETDQIRNVFRMEIIYN